jgi:hypothetical protein
MTRYFPEVVEAVRRGFPARAVVDGEIVIAGHGGLDFWALQQRIHPAPSRVAPPVSRRVAPRHPGAPTRRTCRLSCAIPTRTCPCHPKRASVARIRSLRRYQAPQEDS